MKRKSRERERKDDNEPVESVEREEEGAR